MRNYGDKALQQNTRIISRKYDLNEFKGWDR